jgi:VCBS repeat-containing protein
MCKEHVRMTTTTRSDPMLQQDVLDEIAFDPAITATDIGITVAKGVVTLRGTVSSYSAKVLVEQAAKRVAGVHAFTDELTVDIPDLHLRDDKDIAAAVLHSLKWDVTVVDKAIMVKVQNGYVTLEGEAEWQYQINSATRAIQHLTGVTGVSNLMTLKKRAVTRTDVLAQLERTFARSAAIDAEHIKIEVKDSSVTLRGTVHSWNEYDDATRAAFSLPGVMGVLNLTEVS